MVEANPDAQMINTGDAAGDTDFQDIVEGKSDFNWQSNTVHKRLLFHSTLA